MIQAAMQSTHSSHTYAITTSSAALVCMAGILHFIAAPERYAVHPLLGIFFITLGVLQTMYASFLMRTPTRKLILFGIIFNTGLLLLWLLSQGLPHLAGSSRESLSLLSGARKVLELLSVELLLQELRQHTKAHT